MDRRRRFLPVLVLSLVLLIPTGAHPVQAAAPSQAERCFTETAPCMSGRFRTYWEENGGLAVFGYPLGRAEQRLNTDTGET